MLTIRPYQQDMFDQAAVHNFENRVFIHLLRYFPNRCRSLGEPRVRCLIEEGIGSALRYGLKTEIAVTKYINLLIMLGRGFDKLPPWNEAFQEDQLRADLDPRLDELYEHFISSAKSRRS